MRRTDFRRPADGQPGFTLIEIMVATLLLLVVLAGFIPFFLSGLEKSSAARYQSAATNLAREMMEQIRQLDYREIQEDGAQPTDPANLSNQLPTTRTIRGTTFNVAFAVENSSSGGGLLKKVTVTVSWVGPPVGQPAVITSLIHQQFLGPRGSLLELIPGAGTVAADPLGSPFSLISGTLTARYHIASADWDLVYSNLNQVGMAARNVYVRMAFVNDAGLTRPLGNSASDYKIGTSALSYSVGTDGKVDDVWFDYTFDSNSIPDGYWELQAVAYNEYDQPGNLWRLRLRLDHSAPDPPVSVLAVAGIDDQSILLSWVPGEEGDRDHWTLERRTRAADGTWPSTWTSVTTLPGTAAQYTDVGSVASTLDPWGSVDLGVTNFYEYRLWAVDWAGNVGAASSAQEQIPSAGSTTTTSGTTTTGTGSTTTTAATTTTTGATTTTTAATTTTTSGPLYYSVTVRDNTSKAYDVTVKDAANTTVFTGRVAKNGGTLSITNLASGSYSIQAVEVVNVNAKVITQSFSVPAQAGMIVLDIF